MAKTTLSWIDEENGAVNAIWVDAVLVENYSQTADATEFVIEGGATISDHISPNQPTLTLEIFISDTPIDVPQSHMAAGVGRGLDSVNLNTRPLLRSGDLTRQVTQPGPVIGLPSKRLIRGNKEAARGPIGSKASVLQFTGRIERIANVFDVLKEILNNGIPCEISMLVGTFKDLLITNLDAPRDAASGTGMTFTVDFKQIKRASSEITQGTRKKPKPKKPRNDPSKDAGNKDITEPNSSENTSILEDISRLWSGG